MSTRNQIFRQDGTYFCCYSTVQVTNSADAACQMHLPKTWTPALSGQAYSELRRLLHDDQLMRLLRQPDMGSHWCLRCKPRLTTVSFEPYVQANKIKGVQPVSIVIELSYERREPLTKLTY